MGVVEIITLFGVVADLLSTVTLACLSGHCESDCCGKEGVLHLEHREKGPQQEGVEVPEMKE